MPEINQTVSNLLQSKLDVLSADPKNLTKRYDALKTQVDVTSWQFNITQAQAGQVVKATTSAYAMTKGLDPQEVLNALQTNEQMLLQYTKDNPTIFGVDLVTANIVAGYLAVGQTIFFGGFLIASAVALFTVGPEALAAVAGAEGFFQALGAVAKVPAIRNAAILFGISEIMGALSTRVPMITKQMIDNGSIGPGLRISSIKEAEDLAKQLQGTATPGSFTGTQFADYTKSLGAAGVTTINNPCNATTQAFSAKALADLVTCIYGKATLTGKGSTVTKLIPQLAPYLGTGTAPVGVVSSSGSAGGTTTNAVSTTVGATAKSSTASGGTATSIPQVKVFTGIISQGIIGTPVTFIPTENGFISSVEELQTSAQNNLASFVAGLLGKVTYDVKIVSSVRTADGMTRVASSQQVLTGYTSTGVAKYKTVFNKWAICDIYLLTDKGTRTKITTIILGPTDSVKLQPTSNALASLSLSVQSNLTTSNVIDIKGISTASPITVSAPTISTPTVAPAQQTQQVPTVQATTPSVSTPATSAAPVSTPVQTTPAPVAPAPVLTVGATASAPQANYCMASNLSEFYNDKGLDLPSVSSRSLVYEGLGLGGAGTYVGTAEQNTRLLAAQKIRYGCS